MDKSSVIELRKKADKAEDDYIKELIGERTFNTDLAPEEFIRKFKAQISDKDAVAVINTTDSRGYGVALGKAFIVVDTTYYKPDYISVDLHDQLKDYIFNQRGFKISDSKILKSFAIYKDEQFTASMMPSTYGQAKNNFNLK